MGARKRSFFLDPEFGMGNLELRIKRIKKSPVSQLGILNSKFQIPNSKFFLDHV